MLSEFAGAAQSLGAGAILVNPWNITDMAAAIEDALTMSDQVRQGDAAWSSKDLWSLLWEGVAGMSHVDMRGSCGMHVQWHSTLPVKEMLAKHLVHPLLVHPCTWEAYPREYVWHSVARACQLPAIAAKVNMLRVSVSGRYNAHGVMGTGLLQERRERHRQNYMHVTIHTSQTWADTFISELNDTHVEAELRTKHIPPQVKGLLYQSTCRAQYCCYRHAPDQASRSYISRYTTLLALLLQDSMTVNNRPPRCPRQHQGY